MTATLATLPTGLETLIPILVGGLVALGGVWIRGFTAVGGRYDGLLKHQTEEIARLTARLDVQSTTIRELRENELRCAELRGKHEALLERHESLQARVRTLEQLLTTDHGHGLVRRED